MEYQFLTDFLKSPGYGILLLFASIGLFISIYLILRYIKSRRRRYFLRQAFSYYLAPSAVEELVSGSFQTQNSRKILSVFASKFRGLTTQVESLSPEEVSRLVNTCSSLITNSIFNHEGLIESRSLSNILAYWNVLLDDSRHAENACRAALEVSKRLRAAESIDYSFNIGIDTGECWVGFEPELLPHKIPVIGTAVDFSKHLIKLSQKYGVDIVIGENTFSQLKDFAVLELDSVFIVGRLQPVRIYALVGDQNCSQDTEFLNLLENHTKIVDAFRRKDFQKAEFLIDIFKKQLHSPVGINLDKVYDIYLEEIRDGQKTKSDWDGTLIISDELEQKPPDHFEPPDGSPPLGEPDRLDEEKPKPIQFTVYHPQEICPEYWYTLLVYIHLPEKRELIESDKDIRLSADVAYGKRNSIAFKEIERYAQVDILPELPGCMFNPPTQRILWIEDWHRVEFRLKASDKNKNIPFGEAVNGIISFYIESVLVGEVKIWTLLSKKPELGPMKSKLTTASADPYSEIFVSYSHEDQDVVDKVTRAYKVLGMRLLQDISILRSGEAWNSSLLNYIEDADIFQLYWSEASKRSNYVEQEWRYALTQDKPNFIRPVYWNKPLPDPPEELRQFHFSYLPDLTKF
jgi:class 3 adenylate cyclase